MQITRFRQNSQIPTAAQYHHIVQIQAVANTALYRSFQLTNTQIKDKNNIGTKEVIIILSKKIYENKARAEKK